MVVRYAGAVRVAALALLWGSGFLWIAVGLRGFSPIQVTVLRMALGAAVLLLILRWRGMRLPSGGKVWGHLAVAALFGNALPYLLFSVAEQDVPSSVAGVINSSTPLWTVLFMVLSYRSARTAKLNAWSLVLGALGVLLIFSPWRHGGEIASWPGLACLAAASSYGISYVYISHHLTNRKLGVMPMAAGQLLCATGITGMAIPFTGWSPITWRLDATLAVAILGTLGTGIAYLINYRIITDDGPTAASIVVYLLPVVAIVLGVVILQEAIQLQALIGVVVVLVAAYLRRPEPPPAKA